MNSRDFVFWLNGLLEAKNSLSIDQIQTIKYNLQACFKKETPVYNGNSPVTKTTLEYVPPVKFDGLKFCTDLKGVGIC